MLKRNQFYVSLFASSLVLLGSTAANAEESVTSNASVVVQNAFDFTEVTPLSFGTIRATYTASGAAATIVLTPNGTSTPTSGGAGEPAVATLIPGQPAEYAIANASSFTPLTVTLPSTDVFLTNSQASSQAARFKLDAFTFADADSPGTVLSGSGATITTSNLGTASMLLGARLSTEPSAGGAGSTTAYVDGTYQGSFTVTVSY